MLFAHAVGFGSGLTAAVEACGQQMVLWTALAGPNALYRHSSHTTFLMPLSKKEMFTPVGVCVCNLLVENSSKVIKTHGGKRV